jgi:N-acyl-phosphatidylethanolamine-hydrolysing phospholipase D
VKKRYSNPFIKDIKKNSWDFFLWKVGYYRDGNAGRFPPQDFSYPIPPFFDPEKDSAVWIGHSTFLVRSQGVTLLTDPIWNFRCSPFKFVGPKRRHEPPFSIEDLPQIDFVLISHNHYDHLDEKTVRALAKKQKGITWIVPTGVKKWFDKRKIANVYEMGWWQECKFQKENVDLHVTATPTQHFSGRGLWDTNQTLWSGYVVSIKDRETKTLYFVGDTGYNQADFKEIGKRCPSIDLSLIPIGTYSPREFMKTVHICPKEAVQIHSDVGSRFSIGMHWKTFHLSDEPMNLPPYDLFLALKEAHLSYKNFIAVNPGVYVNW